MALSPKVDPRSREALRLNHAQERARQMKEHAKKNSVCSSFGGGTKKESEWEKEKQEICKNYTIAPSYNKGALSYWQKQY